MTEKEENEIWFNNRKKVALFILACAVSLAVPYFRKFNEMWPHVHPVWPSILAGVIVALVTYFPAKYADSKYGFSHAVLMGLLVSEFCVYGAPKGLVSSPVLISFFLYMFYIGESEADHLWPEEH